MQLKDHVCLMAKYNQSINQTIYAAAEKLSLEQLNEDSGAFFGSVLGTLNHIAVGDTTWLKRLITALPAHAELKPVAELPLPESLRTILCDNLPELRARRSLLDKALLNFAAALTEAELLLSVSYQSMKGDPFTKNLFGLLMHVFNHQTHHRGQVTTLLSQFGVDYGSTDLVVLVPNV
jgi:uncharacterized damage-inducible protein DinB